MRNLFAILLAGGKGKRFGAPEPKQFLSLGDKPLVQYSLEVFREFALCKSLVIVSEAETLTRLEELLSPFLEPNDRIVEGGKTRHDSCLAGLAAIPWDAEDIVFFHDVARPFFSVGELHDLVAATLQKGAASLVASSQESVVMGKDRELTQSLPREEVYLVKTPQAVRGSVLQELKISGYWERTVEGRSPTDLCSWVAPRPVALVTTERQNLKITTPQDAKIARALLEP